MAEPADRLARLLKARKSFKGRFFMNADGTYDDDAAGPAETGSATAYTTSDDIADADARTQNEGTYTWWAKEF